MSEELKSKFEVIKKQYLYYAVTENEINRGILLAMQAAYNMAKSDEWVSVEKPPKVSSNVWYQCATHDDVFLMAFVYTNRGFMAYGSAQVDNRVAYYKPLPKAPNQ